jgi:hypothetical protein
VNVPSSAAEQLNWRKCAHDTWCAFETAVLPDANASGILVVWSGAGEPEQIIYIGQGGIAKNLKWARQFEPIVRRQNLSVSWANVPDDAQNGVRNYLLERLSPVYRDPPTPDTPIPVNLPWERVKEGERR